MESCNNNYILEIEDGLFELLSIRESIQKYLVDEQPWDFEEKSFFSIYTLLEEISEATGFLKITKDSYTELSGTSVHGRKTAIGHVLLKICRYLLLEAEEKGKITVKMRLSCGKAVITM